MTENINTRALSLVEIEAAYQERLDYVADCLEIGVARIVESINKQLGTNWVPDERRSAEMGTSFLIWGVYDPLIESSYLDLDFNYEELPMDSRKGFYYNLVLNPSASSCIEMGFPMEHLVISEGQVQIDVVTNDEEDFEPVISFTKPVSKKFLFGENAARAVKTRDEKIRMIEKVPCDQKSYDAVKSVFGCLPQYEMVEHALAGRTEILLKWYEDALSHDDPPTTELLNKEYPTMSIQDSGEIRFILPYTSRVVYVQRETIIVSFPERGSTHEATSVIEALRKSKSSGRVVDLGGNSLSIEHYLSPISIGSVLYDVELYNGFGERVDLNNPMSLIQDAFPNSKIISRRFEESQYLQTYIEKNIEYLINISDFPGAVTIAKIHRITENSNRLLLGCVWARTKTHKDWNQNDKLNLAITVDSGLQHVFDVSKFNIALLSK